VVRHAGAVVGLAFHPSQPILYTASADKTVQATTLATPRLAADSGRFGVAFAVTSNGASTVSAGNGKGLAIANSTTSAAERVVSDLTGVTAIAVNKANTQLAAYTPANQTVSLFNSADGTLIGSWKAPAAVLELSSHPTLPSLVGVLADNRVVAWNTLTEAGQPLPVEFGKVGMELPHPAAVKGVAVVGDSLLSVADDKKLRAWKFVADAPSRTYQHPSGVNAVAFDKTGTRLATGGQDGVLRIWDATKKDGAAKAINAHVPPQPAPPRAIYAVAWAPDAKQVVTGSDDQSIKIWDAAAGTLVREIKPGKDAPPTPEAVKAAAPAVLGTAQVPSLNLPPPPGHTDQVYALAVSPDGQFLVSGSADKTVKLWNLATGELVRAFVSPGLKPDGAAHPGFVQSVRFTPDGTKAVSVGSAPKNMGFVAVWNVADGKRLAAYEMPTGPIYSVDVTADGTAVLGCGPKTRGVSESDAVVLPLTK
jgi:WD40 repeat protein